MGYILALDLGTTGNRAFIFDIDGKVIAQAYRELTQYYPQPGWVEHNPQKIWTDTCWVMENVIKKAEINLGEIVAIGLTVQRETCLLWNKTTGEPLHNAIVWQDRRTAAFCQELQEKGYGDLICDRTGLVIDAYFSASKLRWLLDQCQDVHLNNILAGTIDTWIIWKLTEGKVHATDHSNASRTMLMNLATCEWDQQLLELFQIPIEILPQIQPSFSEFGYTSTAILGTSIPITAVLGDQQASLFGHNCTSPGLMKCTYGTGSFLVANTGNQIVSSGQKLISTLAWTQVRNERLEINYALEGSMFTAGSSIQWLRDRLKLITTAAESETMANQVTDNGGVYFVPALSGLGAPHWDMNVRGAFLGLTAGVQSQHIVRSVLEAIAFQVKEVVQAIETSSPIPVQRLAVDGGACENNFLMQLQADILGIPVERPVMRDTTVQGIAFAAGLTIGFWDNYEVLQTQRQIERIFEPRQEEKQILDNFHRWQKAVQLTKSWGNLE
jgi:glycerol kinase